MELKNKIQHLNIFIKHQLSTSRSVFLCTSKCQIYMSIKIKFAVIQNKNNKNRTHDGKLSFQRKCLNTPWFQALNNSLLRFLSPPLRHSRQFRKNVSANIVHISRLGLFFMDTQKFPVVLILQTVAIPWGFWTSWIYKPDGHRLCVS